MMEKIKQGATVDTSVRIFLDCGAFSVDTGKATITIDTYIDFIKEHEHLLEVYANLDVIGDPEQTLKNQEYMESKGLRPMPVFHRSEPIKYLEHYIENYDYIALGGMASVASRYQWLDHIWSNYLTDEDGYPIVKVHGFGLTAISLVTRYPWFSVDSSAALKTAIYGFVWIPVLVDGEYDYMQKPRKIFISDKASKNVGVPSLDFYACHKLEQKLICDYFEINGLTPEGLAVSWKDRISLNMKFIIELEKQLPDKPRFDKEVIRGKSFFGSEV